MRSTDQKSNFHSNILGTMFQWYFVAYYVIKNFIVGKTPRNTIGISKAIDAAAYFSALQIMNIKFLLEHVFYSNSRHCQSCNDFTRQGMLIVIGIFVLGINIFIFRKQSEKRVVIKNIRLAKVSVFCYVIVSLFLLFI